MFLGAHPNGFYSFIMHVVAAKHKIHREHDFYMEFAWIDPNSNGNKQLLNCLVQTFGK